MLALGNTVLAIIDFQGGLLPKIHGADDVLARAAKLVQFARELGVPIMWTEQYPKGLGKTVESLAVLLDGLTPIEKLAFGCFGEDAFSEAVATTGRTQLLVAGIEAHVCVLQTVLAGLDRGYEVFVASDAVGSRVPSDCKAGVARMQANGAEIVTTGMAMFEMLGAAGTPEFKKILPLIK